MEVIGFLANLPHDVVYHALLYLQRHLALHLPLAVLFLAFPQLLHEIILLHEILFPPLLMVFDPLLYVLDHLRMLLVHAFFLVFELLANLFHLHVGPLKLSLDLIDLLLLVQLDLLIHLRSGLSVVLVLF